MRAVLLDQCGVITRQQILGVGLTRADLQRMVRRHELVRMHTGVFLDHTGPPTWQQRAWAAVLACAPAGLARGSALRGHEGPGSRRTSTGAIELLIHRDRKLMPPAGVLLHRVVDLDRRVRWNLGPPRDAYEAAVLDVALAGSSRLDRVAELSTAVQSRRTTADRLISEIERRARVPDRAWMLQVLADVAAGSCSVLEHGYLTRVERAHGLRGARRQVRDRLASGAVYRDVEYACADGSTLIVELDGRLHHDDARQRDADLERDLDTALAGARTVRMGWGQVFGRECRTAAAVAELIGVAPGRCPRCR